MLNLTQFETSLELWVEPRLLFPYAHAYYSLCLESFERSESLNGDTAKDIDDLFSRYHSLIAC